MSSRTPRVTPEKIARFIENNPGADEKLARRALRGHANTPEHGKVRSETVAGRTISETASNQAVERIVAQAAREGRRVSIAVADRTTPEGREVFTNRGRNNGISARYLLEEKQDSGGSWKSYLQGTQFGGDNYDYGKWQPQNITSIRVTVY